MQDSEGLLQTHDMDTDATVAQQDHQQAAAAPPVRLRSHTGSGLRPIHLTRRLCSAAAGRCRDAHGAS